MNLPTLKKLDVSGKNVLVRCDLDLDIDDKVASDKRFISAVKSIQGLSDAKKIVIIAHRGRPQASYQKDLTLEPLASMLSGALKEEVHFLAFAPFLEDFSVSFNQALNEEGKYYLVENLRFWTGEKESDPAFIDLFTRGMDAYVNEAFATSHRECASIVGMALSLRPSVAVGYNFEQEMAHLDQVLKNPARPVVTLLSGVKEDKLKYVEGLTKISDKLMIAGRLPEYLGDAKLGSKVFISRLTPDKEDITIHSIEAIEAELEKAETIVIGGPVGKFEDEGHMLGTKRVFEAAAKAKAYKLVGGGDTSSALEMLGLTDKFDWVSTGGGAMLEYLVSGTLPGIKALLD